MTDAPRESARQRSTGNVQVSNEWDYPSLGKCTHTRRIMLSQGASFSLLIALLWANELADLPHVLFRGKPTPPNWCEGAIETAVVLVIAVGVLSWTSRLLSRIRHLEGLLPICMFCKRIRLGGGWVPVDRYITEHSDVCFSHGMCEECMNTHYPELYT